MRLQQGLLFFAIAAILLAAPAGAQPADPATRQAARKIAEEGLKLYGQGDYKGALEKFNLADSLVPATTLGLQAARSLVKLGRLVEASERYLEVMRAKLDKTALPVHKKAQLDALKERDELLVRIPTVEIRVEGPLGEGKVMVDGVDVPPALFGQKRPIDPGKHTIVAKRPDTSVTREVMVGEGDTALAILRLPPLPPPAVVKPVKSPAVERQELWATVAFGVGAGGLLAGAVNGIVALKLQGDLREGCDKEGICPPTQHGKVDLFRLETTASTIGFILGLAGAGAGVTLLLTMPEDAKPGGGVKKSMPATSLWLGPAGAGIKGEF